MARRIPARRGALGAHDRLGQPGDPNARRPRPEEDQPLAGERLAAVPQRGQDPAGHDRGRALDVIVEAGDPVPVAVEQPERVVLLEVLPLHDGAGIDLADRLNEGLDERVVARAAQPWLGVAEVERVIEQARVVGAAVQRHRQRHRRVHARAGAIQRELPDRDAHPARALIAQAQDPLIVGGNDQPDPVPSGVVQQLGNMVDVLGSDPQAAWPAQDVAEPAARLTDCRGVNDRRELFQVIHEQPVKERLVAILQRLQPDVPLQVG